MAKSRARKLADIIVGAGIDIDGNLTFDGGSTSADLTFADNDKANFGDASDLQIYHDGSNSYIKDTGTGDLIVEGSNNIWLMKAGGSEVFLNTYDDGTVQLYHDNSVKLATTSTGVTITGTLVADGLTMGDNELIQLGTGNDLRIYHDGSHSRILENGTGNLIIQGTNLDLADTATGETFLRAVSNDSVEIYYDGSKKFETTSTGISVTGDVDIPDGNYLDLGSGGLTLRTNANNAYITESTSGKLAIQGQNIELANTAGTETFAYFSVDGAATLYYDNSAKLATTSTGVDVTGTVTADSLTVGDSHTIGNGTGDNLFIQSSSGENITLRAGSTREILLQTNNSSGNAVQIYANNDVAFYEDTGNTPKLFWDASAELLEVSSTGNGYAFRPSSTSSDYALMHVQAQDGTGLAAIRLDGSSGLRFHTNGTNNTAEKMRINSSGNVGIGTTSPSSMLHLQDSSDPIEIRLEPQGQANYPKLVGASAAGTNDTYFAVDFVTRGEALRVDGETGNVGIGTTSPSQKLDIRNSGSAAAIKLRREDTSDEMLILIGSSYGYVQNTTGPLGLGGSGGDRDLFIATSGNVGIGTISPSKELQISGTAPTLRLQENSASSKRLDISISSSAVGIIGANQSASALAFETTGSERMRIDSSGNVGIGTSSPSGKLDVAGNVYLAKYSGTGENQTILAQNDYGQMRAGIRSGIPYIGSITSLDFALYTGNSERVRIDTAGNVGIGTSPSSKLHVSGSGTLEVARFETTTDSTPSIGIYSNSGVRTVLRGSTAESALLSQGSTPLLLGTNNTERMRIDASGQVGIGTSSPQELLHLSATTPVFRLEGGSRSYQQFVSGTDFVIRDVTATANRIYLNSSGNVGIGTSNSYGLTHWQDNSTINLIATNTGADGQTDTTVMSLIGQARGYSNNLAKLANIDFKTDPNTWYRGVMTFNVANFDGTDTSRTPLEAMRIDSAGNVGIGTGNVIRAPLQVHNSSTGTGSTNFRISRSVDSSAVNRKFAIILGTDAANLGSTWKMESESSNGYNDNAKLNFIHNSAGTPSTRVTFAHDGKVGIGTASPYFPLHVQGANSVNGAASTTALFFDTSSAAAGTGGGIALGGYTNGTGGDLYHFGNIQGIKENSTAGNYDSAMIFSTRINGTAPQEKLRITSTGRVGIGTTSPFAKLQVAGSEVFIHGGTTTTGPGIFLGDNNFANSNYYNSAPGIGAVGPYGGVTAGLAFYVYGSQANSRNEAMRIDSNGNVGIGTTSMSSITNTVATLSLGGTNAGVSGGIAYQTNGTAEAYHYTEGDMLLHQAVAGIGQRFLTNNTEAMRIDTSGNVSIGVTSASARLDVRGGSGAGTLTHAVFTGTTNRGAEIRTRSDISGGQNSGCAEFNSADSEGDGGDIALSSNGNVRMFIHGAGNVGIGTASPAAKLEVRSAGSEAGGAEIRLQHANNNTNDVIGTVNFANNVGSAAMIQGGTSGANNSGYISFHTDNAGSSSEKMRIDSSGNLLVGTTAAVGKFSIEATPTGTARSVDYSNTGGTVDYYVVNNVNVGSISVSTSATAYNTSSDQRLKENIVDAPSASADIDAIQVRSFDWKADGSHQKYGMVAQELLEVAPEAVTAPEDPEEMMGVDYSKLVPMLVKEIQSLRARVAELEGE